MRDPKQAYIPLKELSLDDRPRERLMAKGANALSNAEILAILIGSGTREKSAVQLSREILTAFDNDLDKFAIVNLQNLLRFRGIGEAKAVTLLAALELGRRRKNAVVKPPKHINISTDAFHVVKERFEDLQHEEFHVILMSRSNKVQAVEMISRGGISGTTVDGKIIFRSALEHRSSGIILCHNHPSGTLKPSDSDKKITRSLIKFGELVDIRILDHLIVTSEGYYSFKDHGLIS
jgi:DNA repair protein RadC